MTKKIPLKIMKMIMQSFMGRLEFSLFFLIFTYLRNASSELNIYKS